MAETEHAKSDPRDEANRIQISQRNAWINETAFALIIEESTAQPHPGPCEKPNEAKESKKKG